MIPIDQTALSRHFFPHMSHEHVQALIKAETTKDFSAEDHAALLLSRAQLGLSTPLLGLSTPLADMRGAALNMKDTALSRACLALYASAMDRIDITPYTFEKNRLSVRQLKTAKVRTEAVLQDLPEENFPRLERIEEALTNLRAAVISEIQRRITAAGRTICELAELDSQSANDQLERITETLEKDTEATVVRPMPKPAEATLTVTETVVTSLEVSNTEVDQTLEELGLDADDPEALYKVVEKLIESGRVHEYGVTEREVEITAIDGPRHDGNAG